MNIDDYTDLFREAFEPLRARLNEQAERIRQGKDPHNQFSPWLICTGKGGSQQTEYLHYPDISLYRHCMDVATVAFMLFTHAWQANRLPGLPPEDEAGAQAALQILLAIAFLHDADKYRDQTDAWGKSQSPELADVAKLYDLLEVGHWTDLSVQECFALVSRVETGRGKKNALFTPPPPDPMTDMLAAMVAEGDKLTSIASRPEHSVAQGRSGHKSGNRSITMRSMLRRLVDVYNDEKRLKAWIAQYNVPDERLRLLEFRQSPVVLHHLRTVCLEHLYYKERFPLVCLHDGERLSITVPKWFDVAEVFEDLQGKLAFNERDELIKRNHTNGELSLLHIHDVTTLIRVATDDSYEPRVLTVHINDWDAVIDYIRSWVGAVGGLVIRDQSATGKLLLPVTVHDTADPELPERYASALAIACALRSDAKGKLFEERLQRIRNWQDGRVECGLQNALSGVALDGLDKNTQQAICAMQAAMEIHDSEVLYALVEHLHESFPPRQADTGAEAIIRSLKSQCGLLTDNDEPDELVYAPDPQGGTCLLTGAPATQQIRSQSMILANVNTSAFNNRMGHRKSLWSQTEKNYISEAALKQQALLVDTLVRAGKPATGQPLLVAMPFRSVIKPQDIASGEACIVNSFMAVNEKDAGWKHVLPWNLDVSEALPLMLETVDSGFDSLLRTMYRMALLALYSGDPVHVFIAVQRDLVAAFAFEQTPPLLQVLLRDLTATEDVPGTIRRDKLPDLVRRLDLFQQIIPPEFGRKDFRSQHGHAVLSVLPMYGWWAVAWLYTRLAQDNRSFSSDMVTIARKVCPMEQDNQLERIAELATHVQRNPDRRASNSERTFAFTTVLEPFTTGKQYGQSESVIIAAMAETLVNALDRREMYARGEGSLAERCQAFAREAYAFMTNNTDQGKGKFDARFHRFLLAAYANLFMAKHTTSNKQEVTSS